MNYFRHYTKLIRNAQATKYTGFGENHHIFPQSIFGKNSLTVRLTYRQHLIAHLLLWRIYKKRYGENHKYTHKMLKACLVMSWTPVNSPCPRHVSSRAFSIIKKNCLHQFLLGEANPSKRSEVRLKISKSKLGISRPDMIGKRYCGGSKENIEAGIARMVEKKTGMKIKYPKDRKKKGITGKNPNIAASLKETWTRITNMTADEFTEWISTQSLYAKDGKRRNSNVCRMIKLRNEPTIKYYVK